MTWKFFRPEKRTPAPATNEHPPSSPVWIVIDKENQAVLIETRMFGLDVRLPAIFTEEDMALNFAARAEEKSGRMLTVTKREGKW